MTKSLSDKQRNSREKKARRQSPAQLANLKTFLPGQSGNPNGRPKSITLSEAYRKMLAQVDECDALRRTNAEVLAEKMCGMARAGNVSALREIADRVEGKPHQAIALTIEKREQLERAIENLISSEEKIGNHLSREAAIETLALFLPEASHLIN